MISELERYKRVCSQIDRYATYNQEIFNRFVQLSLATVGGFLWLKTQANVAAIADLLPLVRWILPALAAVTVTELMLNYWGWFKYRTTEAKLIKMRDARPRFPFSGRTEFFRSAVAVAVGITGAIWLR